MEEVAKEDEEEAEEGGRARGGAGEGEERWQRQNIGKWMTVDSSDG